MERGRHVSVCVSSEQGAPRAVFQSHEHRPLKTGGGFAVHQHRMLAPAWLAARDLPEAAFNPGTGLSTGSKAPGLPIRPFSGNVGAYERRSPSGLLFRASCYMGLNDFRMQRPKPFPGRQSCAIKHY